jgi:hypothetical protein
MDGWMDGWMDRMMDGWMDGWSRSKQRKLRRKHLHNIKMTNRTYKNVECYKYAIKTSRNKNCIHG